MLQLGTNRTRDSVRGKPGPRGPGGLREAGEGRREAAEPTARPWALGCAQTSPCYGSSWPGWGWRTLFWPPRPSCVGRQAGGGPWGSPSSWQQLCPLEGGTVSSGGQWSPGPLPLLAPYGFSSHLATACTGTLSFMAKEGSSMPPLSGTQATSGPQAGRGASCPAWLSDGHARFS